MSKSTLNYKLPSDFCAQHSAQLRAAADLDLDGNVDGKDLVRWKSISGSTPASHMKGDADGDHDVDGADFLVWQRQLGPGLDGRRACGRS